MKTDGGKRIIAEAPDNADADREKFPKTEGDEPDENNLIPDEPDQKDPVTNPAPDRERRS